MGCMKAGEGGKLIHLFKEKKIIALGFNEVGDISGANNIDDIKNLYRTAYPIKSEVAVGLNSSQIYNFLKNFKKGDYVVSYDPKERTYHIGEVVGDFEYNEDLIKEGFNKIRRVNWVGKVSRDDLSVSTQNTLGAWQTIFEIKDENKEEILSFFESERPTFESKAQLEETLGSIMEKTVDRSFEFIKDKIIKLEWQDMQKLMAGILRAMGYKTIITGTGGPDRGKDIVASVDELGLEGPKIKVEVKHQKNSIGSPDIRNFVGGLREGQKGIYVSTGGFTKEAYYEAERSNYPLTLVDADIMVELINRYYDNFDIETRTLIPLKKFYWPVSD